jgi:hypothetical protein
VAAAHVRRKRWLCKQSVVVRGKDQPRPLLLLLLALLVTAPVLLPPATDAVGARQVLQHGKRERVAVVC